MKKIISIVLLFSSLTLASLASAAEGPLNIQEQCASWGVDSQQAIKFAKILQTLVKKDMKNELAQLAGYPVHINKQNKNGSISRYDIKTKQQFIKHYSSIITRKTRLNMIGASTDAIICNYRGVGFLSGWFWSKAGDAQSFDTVNVW